LLVPDTLRGLQHLAAYWRSLHADCRVVGITGSVGKTTTKELVAAVLRQRFCTLKSLGNYNNEIGLPLTMMRLHPAVEWVVQELGMYSLGEIAYLAQIAQPEIGVVTNVGPVHLERLGSLERIAQAKAELPEALPAQGVAILNGDDPWVRAMGQQTKAQSILCFGLDSRNDLWADEVHSFGLEGLRLRFRYRGHSVHARLPLLGRHSVYGALAAAAVGLGIGLSWDEIISGLRDPSAQLRLTVLAGIAGTTILDDTYNASPASTTAALNLLAEMDGRKVAVLGDMLELGSYEVAGHELVGRRAADVVSLLVVVGQLGRLIGEEALAAGMPADAVHVVDSNQEAVEVLSRVLAEGDFVLVKGSRGMAMEDIVASLVREG
jgi:UDP-N-acetylmuramoyl-tripeptide--D-alanyl-D-alanine ligase